ncbi:hypothetical protein K435DRAFT_966750 [Dendrothele bispora CBS 962.96]|uniref:Cell morphogenesis protein n=1 Tax=Dendrothele bispora (strain CBS 962.96) TaxID=1314807 RepID=A0A4S8LYF2_DENBC|nr:hypothetical protein K435DRAFT_966750 [Dendrothele bispora CBS 962.96]
MSEGVQITIPDFDDDDYGGSSTIPFGRPAAAFGALVAPDSPTLVTPTVDNNKSYFTSHTRGDSITSLESTGSNPPSASASISTAPSSYRSRQTTAFSKKPSFASIRNAFKTAKISNDPPPVPQLDTYARFNRSTSSLNNHNNTTRGAGTPRPPTPGASKKGHSYAKSQHSHSGSIFHYSDAGSDGHHPSSSISPPPVPRVPNGFADLIRSETPDFEEDKVVIDPKTPSDFALHAVFMRFASTAEAKIDNFLRQPLETDPLLPHFIGPDTDPKFDEILRSLGQIAQKHTKPVLDSIMRWRRSQVENVGSDLIEYHRTMPDTSVNRSIRPSEVPGLLNARKALAAIYIMCRALIAVVQTLSKDAIGENLGYSLEKTIFDQFRKPDLKLLMQSANHRTNADLSAELLGHLANIRFVSVTDRFLAELAPVAQGQVPKDLDMKYENLVQGLKYIQIKVWPSEAFEEGAEFMESLSKAFFNAHGFRLKSTFAETLVQVLHPIGKTAQAETNMPLWAKAIELIHPKAREMAAKPRYWNTAYPLMITSLCVAPEVYFKKHWIVCWEGSLAKMKEKSLRTPTLHGLTRLIWTYLYRCQESPHTTTTKLDSLLKYLFPPNRLGVYPPPSSSASSASHSLSSSITGDDHNHHTHSSSFSLSLEPFILIVHFTLSRHFEYGRDLCLELMQEGAILAMSQKAGGVVNPNIFAPDRTAIAVQAILLSIHGYEREAATPTWPSSTDFFGSNFSSSRHGRNNKNPGSGWEGDEGEDYPTSSAFLPPSLYAKQGIQDLLDRTGTVLAVIAKTCFANVGRMSMFDEQWNLSRLNLSYEEAAGYVVRRVAEFGFGSASGMAGSPTVNGNGYEANGSEQGRTSISSSSSSIAANSTSTTTGATTMTTTTLGYPSTLLPQLSLLQTCFQSWPRCLHLPSLPIHEAIDMLLHGIIHVEPGVGEAARGALKRFLSAGEHHQQQDNQTKGEAAASGGPGANASLVVGQFTYFLFSPVRLQEGSPFSSGIGIGTGSAGVGPAFASARPKLLFESMPLLDLWVNSVEVWVQGLIKDLQQQRTTRRRQQGPESDGLEPTMNGIGFEWEDEKRAKEEEKLMHMQKCLDIEAAGLFLLSNENRGIRAAGLRVVRTLGLLVSQLREDEGVNGVDGLETSGAAGPFTPLIFVELLHGYGKGSTSVPVSMGDATFSPDTPCYLQGFDSLLDKAELTRLEQWRASKRTDDALRIADSTNEKDRVIWRHVFPAFMQYCMQYQHLQNQHLQHYPHPQNGDQHQNNLAHFRDIVVAAASRYHSTISHLAGLSMRGRPGGAGVTVGGGGGREGGLGGSSDYERSGSRQVQENRALIDQWYMWVKILCATATLPESLRPAALSSLGRDHSRAPSDSFFERERLTTSRGLFRYLTPFLDSEYTMFRDAAVLCISSFPPDAYPQLLEDLSLLAGRQFYDDPTRQKLGVGIMSSAASVISSSAGSILESSSNVGLMRQGIEEGRGKAGGGVGSSSILGDRMRRQERLHSAVARIYYLTSRHLDNQRSAGRQATLANVLKFIRHTQTFLVSPEMRENHSLQRLRRYFCGTVERLFESLSTLKDFDRFIPANMHLSLYRLCEEWCTFGPQTEKVKQRQSTMQKAAQTAAQQQGLGMTQGVVTDAVERFQEETLMLSYAAVGALSVLCQKAFSPPSISSGSPTDRHSPDHNKPLTSSQVLERLSAIFTSAHLPTQERGKKALKALLLLNAGDIELQDQALTRAIVTTDETDTSNGRFFEVISETVCSTPVHGFSFSQVVCLALSNLCHPVLATRRQAFDMLEAIHSQRFGHLTMSHFEATVGSSASGTYVHSHRLVSDFLAETHPDQATAMLAQLARWLPSLHATPSDMVVVLLLQSLEFWISNIQLMTEDKVSLSREGHLALYQLMTLTLRYGQSHPEQILVLWTRLVEPPNQSNGHATVRFLLEQSHKVGSTVFVDSAANIVACICQAEAGRQIFEDICSVIEPARMLPTLEHKLKFPDAHDLELWSDLDTLFVDGRPRMSLGSAQFAWLFLADVALPLYWELKDQLPVLLHALFTHLDHRTSFIRLRARRMLFQLLRSWTPGYDELSDHSNHPSRQMLKAAIVDLEKEADGMYWKEDEKGSEVESKMRWFCSRVIQLLEPLCPALRERWGTLALEWGTACSIRSTAFRSLQLFRALLPRVKTQQLALLIGRLSNTISGPEDGVKTFTTEIILTLNSVISSDSFDMTLLPQFFWCTCASLSSTVEHEFAEVVKLLQTLLTRVNFDDPSIVEQLLSHRPLGWNGSDSLQPLLLAGLRSSTTSEGTLKVLQILTSYNDAELIDPTPGRVRDLYTLSLPWCLHSMSGEKVGDEAALKQFAENIGLLARREGRISIHKIMTSFSKGHFRTKDDFLRQSVSSLREHYGTEYWTEIVTLLMGLVLNRERWLRIQTMQILKVLFQQRETRNPVELLGSELLMPLLRLLETDLASQALDVLEEPMTMSGGLAAKHVLRMSMHNRTLPIPKEGDSVPTVFGVPEQSGWSVVKVEELRSNCRANLVAVFDTCSMPTRPSRIEFQPEEMEALAASSPLEEDLGGLVQNLHDLTTFFQDNERVKTSTPMAVPNRRLEARVAAILAKSTALDTTHDVPPTPYVDVFRVGEMSSDEDSDDYSINSDEELDAFYFDSPTIYRSAPNGSRIS